MTPKQEQRIRERVLKQFALTYADVHLAMDLVEKMADGGKPKNLVVSDVIKLQKTLRQALCAANAITGTWDGYAEPIEQDQE